METITINRPTNGAYSTVYAVMLRNTKTGEQFYLGPSARKTKRVMFEYLCDHAEQVQAITKAKTFSSKKGYLALDDTDWIVSMNQTLRELHGQTLNRIA